MSLFKKKEKNLPTLPTGQAGGRQAKTEKTSDKPAVKTEVKIAPKIPTTGATGVKSVLKQPWFSERATILATKNQYVFLVVPEATKPAVRDEIQRRYGVHVTGVNMVTIKGKMKRFRNKMNRHNGVKKAIVTLKAGDKIEIQ